MALLGLGRGHSSAVDLGGAGGAMSAADMEMLLQLRRSQGLHDPLAQRQRLMAMLQHEQAVQQSLAARLPTRNDDLMRMLAAGNSPLQSSLASSVNFSNMASDASLLSNRVQPAQALDTATLQFLRNREQQTSQRLLALQQQLQQQPRDESTTSPKAEE